MEKAYLDFKKNEQSRDIEYKLIGNGNNAVYSKGKLYEDARPLNIISEFIEIFNTYDVSKKNTTIDNKINGHIRESIDALFYAFK